MNSRQVTDKSKGYRLCQFLQIGFYILQEAGIVPILNVFFKMLDRMYLPNNAPRIFHMMLQ